jgi:hypothetical protein
MTSDIKKKNLETPRRKGPDAWRWYQTDHEGIYLYGRGAFSRHFLEKKTPRERYRGVFGAFSGRLGVSLRKSRKYRIWYSELESGGPVLKVFLHEVLNI